MMMRSTEKGSALIFILIAVVLFAALSYTVANMMRGGISGGQTSINSERAGILAGEILDYARTIRQSVQELRISNGCRDTEISFDNSIVAGYANGTNTDCQVFHSDGGDKTWVSPSDDLNDGDEWVFNGGNVVDEVGTMAADLILILPNIKQAVCEKINDRSGITVLGADSGVSFAQFTGTYAAAETIDSAAGYSFGCLNFDNGGTNEPFFYQVLIAR